MTDHLPLELEHFLPYRLSVLSNTISQGIAREYHSRFGLSITEWRAMAVLARYDRDGLSARQVAERTAMDKVAISRAVSKLVARSLVNRKLHQDDRRRSVLALTPEGWIIHDQVAPLARRYEREVLKKLNAEEHACLNRILDKLSSL